MSSSHLETWISPHSTADLSPAAAPSRTANRNLPSHPIQPARKGPRGYTWRPEETDLIRRMIREGTGPQINWKGIVKALAEQVPMGEGLSRTAQQCQSHWRYISKLSKRSRKQKDSGVDDEDDGTFVSKLSSAERKQHSSEARSSSRIQRQQQQQHMPSLVTRELRSFTPEQDEALLELYGRLGPVYKAISRAMEPRMHKRDVRERFDYLLQPYDFSSFFSEEGANEEVAVNDDLMAE